jgi:uncharacterized membrane protein
MSPIPKTERLPAIRICLTAFLATMLALLAVDALWLGVLMGDTYQDYIGHLMRSEPKMLPAALFYLLYPAGLLVFAVRPALRERDWRTAARLGALLGLVAYGTYDLSNMATLRGWPWQMTLVDMAWGTVLSAVAACAGYGAGAKT